MSVGRGNQVDEAGRAHESSAIGDGIISTLKECHDVPQTRTTFVFVFGRGVNAKRLAAVLLVDSHPSASEHHAVVTLGDERGDVTDQAPVSTRGRQAHTARELETEMLVLGKAIEVVRNWLELESRPDRSSRCS